MLGKSEPCDTGCRDQGYSKHCLNCFTSMCLIKLSMLQPYNSTSWLLLGRSFHFILSVRSNFFIVINLSIAVYAFPMHMFISLSVDKILLLRYVNWCTNLRGLPLNEEMATSCLKHMNTILSEFMERPIPFAACSRLCRRYLAWTSVLLA